jgi:hypothetical protein
MFAPYTDRPPDKDGPIDPRSYGVQEHVTDAELWACARASFGILPEIEEPVSSMLEQAA